MSGIAKWSIDFRNRELREEPYLPGAHCEFFKDDANPEELVLRCRRIRPWGHAEIRLTDETGERVEIRNYWRLKEPLAPSDAPLRELALPFE